MESPDGRAATKEMATMVTFLGGNVVEMCDLCTETGAVVTVDKVAYCGECRDRYQPVAVVPDCAMCGAPTDPTDAHVVEGDAHCVKCFTEEFRRCENCDAVVAKEQTGYRQVKAASMGGPAEFEDVCVKCCPKIAKAGRGYGTYGWDE
jgi:hypothetical protein